MNNNKMIGLKTGMSATTITNCSFIGDRSGMDILDGDGILIIGDDVKFIKGSREPWAVTIDEDEVIHIGEKIAIGKKLFGEDNPFWKKMLFHRDIKKEKNEI